MQANQATPQMRADDYQRLIDIGIALSAEDDYARLTERILLEAKSFANADAGTLYLKSEDKELAFQIVRNDSLNIAMGGTTGVEIKFPPVALYSESGAPNMNNVASYSGITGEVINIADAYAATGRFDFSGTKRFDASTGYRSQSFLTVPLKNHQHEVIGVLQLINAKDRTGKVVPFDEAILPMVNALASQAAVSIENRMLIGDLKNLLDSFIAMIAAAIDTKSPYTGGHCQRVPVIAKMLAEAACRSEDPPFRDFSLSEDEMYELHIAAWLHDCGKVTTPEYVVDKATKLETLYNRIHEVRTRFEVVKRDAEIEYLKKLVGGEGDPQALLEERDRRLKDLDDDFAFVAECNVGGEFLSDEKRERLKRIAAVRWQRSLDDTLGLSHDEAKRKAGAPVRPLPAEERLLSDKEEHVVPWPPGPPLATDSKYGFRLDVPRHKFNLGEVYNLGVARGTLTAEDRFAIAEHIVQTIVMLEQLPYPKHLRRVPEYAGGHHEKLDGSGYPRKLDGEHMSIPARIIAISDIFEALTAADRPYKAPKTLSESIGIMAHMRDDGHIDPQLFRLFLASGVYRQYADRHLKPEQIDEVDVARFLGARH